MTTMQDIRAKYPQYNDLSDDELAAGLHKKYYSDMPEETFRNKVGWLSSNDAAKSDREYQPTSFGDVAKSLGSGVMRGVENAAGFPADVAQIVNTVGDKALGAFGIEPKNVENRKSLEPFTSEAMRGYADQIGIPHHEPQSRAGKFAATIGEFAPSAAMGPGGLARKAAMAVIPGAASEAAGQLTEGTTAEPYARAAGALVGGVGTAMAGTGGNATKQIAQMAPSADAVKASADRMYDTLRSAGIAYDPNRYQVAVTDLAKKLHAEGFRPSSAPGALKTVDELVEHIGKSPDYNDIEAARRSASMLSREAPIKSDRKAARAVVESIDQFIQRGAFTTTNSALPPQQASQLMKEARQTAQRNIKSQQIQDMVEKAKTYASGFENGIRLQVSGFMKAGKHKNWSEVEKKALLEMRGTKGRNALVLGGRAGVDLSNQGSREALIPLMTTAAGAVTGALTGGGLGAGLGGLGAIAGGSALKYGARKMAEKATERAAAVARASKVIQDKGKYLTKEQRNKMLIRQLLGLENVIGTQHQGRGLELTVYPRDAK